VNATFASPERRANVLRRVAVAIAIVMLAACSRHKVSGLEYVHDPIPVHVRNENYLDVNVFVYAGGVRRRLGLVPGNTEADYSVDWSVSHGLPMTIVAQAIGSSEVASTGEMNVGYDQMIVFRVGSVMRQSVASLVQVP
jgi:hypothetical protein